MASAVVGKAPDAKFGRVNARRRDPFVVWCLGETLQGLSFSLWILKLLERVGYLLSEWRQIPVHTGGRGLVASMSSRRDLVGGIGLKE